MTGLDRWASDRMLAIFTERATLDRWTQVEQVVAACDPRVPEQAARTLYGALPPSPAEVAKYESETDVVAFLKAWTVGLPTEHGRWAHFGLSSSDLVDTASAVALVQANRYLRSAGKSLLTALEDIAYTSAGVVRLGRTHGVPAEPTDLGHQFNVLFGQVDRAYSMFTLVSHQVERITISGPVGTYAHQGEAGARLESRVADRLGLGLQPAGPCIQGVGRDRYATWGRACLGLVLACQSVGQFVRAGARHGELSEGGVRVGSSSMPHKRNPIISERLTGFARLVKGYASALDDSVSVWDDGEVSHSSVERVAILTDAALRSTDDLVRNLVVDSGACEDNLDAAGQSIHSSWALDQLIEEGIDRWEAHERARLESSTDVPYEPSYAWYTRHAGKRD